MSVRVLDRGDRALVEGLIAADPVLNVFLASRLEADVLARHTPGALWGYPAERPLALLHVGANVMPVGTDAPARRAFAARLGAHRTFVAIVGLVDEVDGLLTDLIQRWGQPYARYRAIRAHQPVLATDRLAPIAPDARVRRLGAEHADSYFRAAVAMYREELDEDPLATNAAGYRRYVDGLLAQGRAYGIVEDGEVVFKADVGATGGRVSQIQGVWLAEHLRGQGRAAPAMAAVTNAITGAGGVASLYVNDFNAPALATYRRCGYTQRGTFRTVLY